MSLILTRKQGEAIAIGDGITVTINKISGNRVQLAVNAPESVKVLRAELVGKEEQHHDAA